MQSENKYVSAESVQDGVSSPKSASVSQTEAINSLNMAGTSPKTLNLSPAKVNMSPSKASRGTFVGGTIQKVSPAGKAMGQFQSEIWNKDNSTGGFVAECVKAKELKDLPKTSIKDRSGPNLLMWLHDNPTTKHAHTITHPSRYGLPDAQDTQKDVTFIPFNTETDRIDSMKTVNMKAVCGAANVPRTRHFHYEACTFTETVNIQVTATRDVADSIETSDKFGNRYALFEVIVRSGIESWTIKRSLRQFQDLDVQVHFCLSPRQHSRLQDLSALKCSTTANMHDFQETRTILHSYMERLSSQLAPPGPVVGCGVILSWLALDEKGQMITDKITGTSTINIPAFAFGRAVLPHTAIDSTKELNIRVGDQIAVIDMREDEFDQLWLVKSNLQTGLVPASCIRLIEKTCPPPEKNIEAPKSSAKRKSRPYNRPTIEHSVTFRDQRGTVDDESEATAVKATETESRRKLESFNGSRNSLSSISQSNNCTAIGAAIVLTEFVARQPGEISLKVGTIVSLLEADSTETMWKGKNSICEVGRFPQQCVSVITKDSIKENTPLELHDDCPPSESVSGSKSSASTQKNPVSHRNSTSSTGSTSSRSGRSLLSRWFRTSASRHKQVATESSGVSASPAPTTPDDAKATGVSRPVFLSRTNTVGGVVTSCEFATGTVPAEDTLIIRRSSSSKTEGNTKDRGIVTDKNSNATEKDSNVTDKDSNATDQNLNATDTDSNATDRGLHAIDKGLNATDKNSNAADDDRGFETVDQGKSLTLPSLTELTSGVADPVPLIYPCELDIADSTSCLPPFPMTTSEHSTHNRSSEANGSKDVDEIAHSGRKKQIDKEIQGVTESRQRTRGYFQRKLDTLLRYRPERAELRRSGRLALPSVFGADLEPYVENGGSDIPVIVGRCMDLIEEIGLIEGIYRKSGATVMIQKVRAAIEVDDETPELEIQGRKDVHVVSGLLKLYFRELPISLLPHTMFEELSNAMTRPTKPERIQNVRQVLRRLPPVRCVLLERFISHLMVIVGHQDNTQMNSSNIAIVWGPNLLRPLNSRPVDAFIHMKAQVSLCQMLIECYDQIFTTEPIDLVIPQEARTHVEKGVGKTFGEDFDETEDVGFIMDGDDELSEDDHIATQTSAAEKNAPEASIQHTQSTSKLVQKNATDEIQRPKITMSTADPASSDDDWSSSENDDDEIAGSSDFSDGSFDDGMVDERDAFDSDFQEGTTDFADELDDFQPFASAVDIATDDECDATFASAADASQVTKISRPFGDPAIVTALRSVSARAATNKDSTLTSTTERRCTQEEQERDCSAPVDGCDETVETCTHLEQAMYCSAPAYEGARAGQKFTHLVQEGDSGATEEGYNDYELPLPPTPPEADNSDSDTYMDLPPPADTIVSPPTLSDASSDNENEQSECAADFAWPTPPKASFSAASRSQELGEDYEAPPILGFGSKAS